MVHAPTTINASGDMGGGVILIGGNYQGKGPERNALTTWVESGVTLTADAYTSGNGGKIIAWSDLYTGFHGSISAQGGIAGGDGGFAETSGHDLNTFGARVNLLAPAGKTGTWLLDPTDVTITTAANSNESFSSGTYTPSGASANIQASDLTGNLATTNVTVTTTSGGGANGDIEVSADLTWTAATTLTLNAARRIYINNPITATNGGLTLSALSGAQSMTTGTIGSGTIAGGTLSTLTPAISVKNFTLSQGQWFQRATSLPTFSVSNDFTITSGSTYNSGFAAQFTRLASTSGTGTIADEFGLQGVATGTMSTNYQINNAISASGTSNWNGGSGFYPIGIVSGTPYTGTFDGQSNTITSLYINRSIDVGLFGNTSGATISNLGLVTPNITSTGGNFAAGIISNALNGSLTSSYVSGGSITKTSSSGNGYAAGLVGFNDGMSITSSYNAGTSVSSTSTGANNAYAGGIAGNNQSATISSSYNTGSVSATAAQDPRAGGIAAINHTSGIVTQSYNTGSISLTSTATGGFGSVGGIVGQSSGGR